MAFETVAFVRLLHVMSAIAWGGGIAFHLLIVAPGFKAAGPGAGPVAGAILRRGGFGLYYGPAAILTILTGGYLYNELGYVDDPTGNGLRTAVTVGAVAGLLAFLAALLLTVPLENRMKRIIKAIPPGTPPSPEQGRQLMALGQQAGPRAWIVFGLVLVAIVGMAGRVLFL